MPPPVNSQARGAWKKGRSQLTRRRLERISVSVNMIVWIDQLHTQKIENQKKIFQKETTTDFLNVTLTA